MDSNDVNWTTVILALIAAIPTTLASIATLIVTMRKSNQIQTQSNQIQNQMQDLHTETKISGQQIAEIHEATIGDDGK